MKIILKIIHHTDSTPKWYKLKYSQCNLNSLTTYNQLNNSILLNNSCNSIFRIKTKLRKQIRANIKLNFVRTGLRLGYADTVTNVSSHMDSTNSLINFNLSMLNTNPKNAVHLMKSCSALMERDVFSDMTIEQLKRLRTITIWVFSIFSLRHT